MKEKIKTIFMGTPELSARALQTLLDSDFFDICAVVSKKDKAVGRKMQIQKSAVKILAEKHKIPVIENLVEEIEKFNPELIVVIAYGKILSSKILKIPEYGCVNVHASLLPKYRGASCISAPILNGDEFSGISVMKMDENMDTGPIIEKIKIKLSDKETGLSLMNKIIELTEKNLVPVLQEYIKGNIQAKEQDNSLASYVKMTEKEDGHLDFENEKAETIERKVRAYHPWPGTYSFIEKNNLQKNKISFKILQLGVNFIEAPEIESAEIFLKENRIAVKCQDKAVIIEKMQLEGKKAMLAPDFLKGNSWIIGKKLK
jgi:methionyl-tRNA formyltransferase